MHGMTTPADRSPLDGQIAQWRLYLSRRRRSMTQDVEELEGHLRDQLAALTETALAGDEAFLVAVKRMGNLDALSREFALEHSERLWKQLVIAPAEPMSRGRKTHRGARRPEPCRRRGLGHQGSCAFRPSAQP